MPGYWRCKISHTEIPTAGAHTSCLGPRPMLPSSGVCDHVCEVRYFHHYFFSHHFLWSNWPTLYVDMYRSCSEDTWRGESLELGLENLTLPKCWTHEIWAPGISKFGSFMGMLKKKEHIKRRGRCVLSYLFILIDKQCFSLNMCIYTLPYCIILLYSKSGGLPSSHETVQTPGKSHGKRGGAREGCSFSFIVEILIFVWLKRGRLTVAKAFLRSSCELPDKCKVFVSC